MKSSFNLCSTRQLNKTSTQQLTLALDNRNGSYNFSVSPTPPHPPDPDIEKKLPPAASEALCLCPATVPHGGRPQGAGSLQPALPLLSQQEGAALILLLLHSECRALARARPPPPLLCARAKAKCKPVQVEVMEKNPGGYLSAAEMPLSRLYIGMAAVFLTAALLWVYILMKHRYVYHPGDLLAFDTRHRCAVSRAVISVQGLHPSEAAFEGQFASQHCAKAWNQFPKV